MIPPADYDPPGSSPRDRCRCLGYDDPDRHAGKGGDRNCHRLWHQCRDGTYL
jgi:hypothetical protein